MKHTRLIPASLLAGVLTLVGTARTAPPPAAQLLPDDTIAVFNLPDLNHLCQVSADSAMWRLWNDPAMGPFREKFLNQLKAEVLDPLEQEAGIKLADYAQLFQGQFTLAVTMNGWTGGEDPLPGLLLIADSGEHAADLKAKLADVRKRIADAGENLQTEQIRGVEFFKLQPPADAKAPNIALHFGQSDSLLLVSVNAATTDLEKVLARLAGSSVPCLADQDQWRQDENLLFRDAISLAWIHATPLVRLAMQKLSELGQQQQGMGPKPDVVANALGLLGLKSLGIASRADASGETADLFIGAPQDSRKGLLNLASGLRGDASPPAFVPADATSFSRTRLSASKIWREIEGIANALMPGMLEMGIARIEGGIKQQNPNFSLRQGIIGNLGDDLVSYAKAPRENTLAGLNAQPSITLIGSSNPGQLLDNLRILVETSGMSLDQRDFLGRKIYSLTIPFAQGPEGPMSFHLCADRGYLAVTMDKGILEEYLRNAGNPPKRLAALPGLAAAAEKVGGMRTGFFGYQNDALLMRSVVETMRAEGNDVLDLFSQGMPASENAEEAKAMIREWVDFSLLPPFDRIKQYFDLSVFAGQVRREGYLMKIYTPMPSGLR